MASDLVDQAVALRLVALRKHPLFDRNGARGIAEQYAKNLRKAQKQGTVEVLEERGRLLGLLTLTQELFHQTGRPYCRINIDLRLGSEKAIRWLPERLREHRKHFKKNDAMSTLLAAYQEALSPIARAGFHIESAILVGSPKTALSRLRKAYGDTLDWPSESGLSLVPLRSPSQVRQIMAINLDEFTRNPQFGWFVTDPRFLKKEGAWLRKVAKEETPGHFAIQKGDRTVGYFGVSVNPKDRTFGRSAGVSFCFAREIQGLGLAKHAYALLLERMVKDKVDAFTGGTSQPPILRMAKVMGRTPIAYLLRTGKGHFPLSHFVLTPEKS